ncbi:MAG: hypothetical protein JW973_06585 [Bacteroidales bacterium]|nr:hypothetical protein [Bacteroidales bacterium]
MKMRKKDFSLIAQTCLDGRKVVQREEKFQSVNENENEEKKPPQGRYVGSPG